MTARLPKFLFPNPNLVTDFTIHCLPYGVFKHGSSKRAGVAIGDKILDLYELANANKVDPSLKSETLNDFMGKGKSVWKETRAIIKNLLSDDHADSLASNQNLLNSCIREQKDVEMVLPARIGDYTDFYASREHATNLGCMFRDASNPLLPNWLHIPVGYHGRASSVQVSGVDFHRPRGQKITPDTPNGPPTWGESKGVDVELEMGLFIGISFHTQFQMLVCISY
jgi:fumarylacetoacetase